MTNSLKCQIGHSKNMLTTRIVDSNKFISRVWPWWNTNSASYRIYKCLLVCFSPRS